MPKAKSPRSITSKNPVGSAPQAISRPEVMDNTVAIAASSTIELESQIRQRAYELYQERGCRPGQENDDWFRAEREVLSRA
jgi:hypothetical protein